MVSVNRRRLSAGFLLWAVVACTGEADRGGKRKPAAAVAVAPVIRGSMVERRTYSGTLEAHEQFVIASKVRGRVKALNLDLGDRVTRGAVVTVLEDDELRQLATQATAALAVAGANLTKAESALVIAGRQLKRTSALRKRGVSSEAQLDTARAAVLQGKADVEVAKADVKRAEAAEDGARIRLRYAQVTAEWSEGGGQRVVAARHVSAGALVTENAPLYTIVELDPITCVLSIPEKDYGRIRVGQTGTLVTDAFPDERFVAKVSRIAPVFDPGSRQARIELTATNADGRLKPGMFVRATLVLETVAEATIVPFSAITTRDGRSGLFVLDAGEKTVSWRLVTLGVRDGERVEVKETIEGSVVTLGQQLLGDGSAVVIADAQTSTTTP